jgi:type VI secretion system FHA domain protein
MLVVYIVSQKGPQVSLELAAHFDERGGTIGRGPDCTLVLPDPDRHISRMHAAISYQAGGYVITDHSTSNPLVCNGRPLGSGKQARLGNGDELKVGGYLLRVAIKDPASSPEPPRPAFPRPGTAAPTTLMGPAKDDPLQLFQPATGGPDPFDDLFRQSESTPARPASEAGTRVARDSSTDPFADFGEPRRGGDDDLLGLAARGSDPFPAGHPLADTNALPIGPAPLRDDAPLTSEQYRPPRAEPERRATPDRRVHPDRRIEPEPLIEPAAHRPDPTDRPAPEPATRAEAGAPGADALLAAFVRGTGLSGATLPRELTPEMMESVGRLLREAISGTIRLLRARSEMKREIRADSTMLLPRENNPLKFLPTVDGALRHLLTPQDPGFMAPLDAVRDAYDDACAHQLGILRGMEAALAEMLTRFDPKVIEAHLKDGSLLDSVLPSSRRAKLWNAFVEEYRKVAADTRESSDAVFGKAFVRSYEEQVKRLRSG